MSEQITRTLDALRREGRRVTTARRLVVELLARTTEHLTADDLATRIHDAHPEIHLSTVYRDMGHGPGECPIAEKLLEKYVSLPIHPRMTDEAVQYVIDAVRGCCD